jgi:hypothetical protein
MDWSTGKPLMRYVQYDAQSLVLRRPDTKEVQSLLAQQAQRDISHYLMHWYSWIRPHQFNHGLAPAVAEEKLNVVSEMG